jgi:hypothetical protein
MRKLLAVVVVLGCLVMIARLIGPSILERTQNHILQSGRDHLFVGAGALHRTLLVADLHADSLLWECNLLSASKQGHIDLPRLVEGKAGIRGFTVFSTIPRRLNIDRNNRNLTNDQRRAVPATGAVIGIGFWEVATWNRCQRNRESWFCPGFALITETLLQRGASERHPFSYG